MTARAPLSPDALLSVASTVALIPLRTGGKSRLQGTLDARRRRELVLAMLDDVLSALHAAGLVDVRVLAGDADAASAAATRGLAVVLDPDLLEPTAMSAVAGTDDGGTPSDERLRRAVDTGLLAVGDERIRLVVAADLPLLSATDIHAVLGSAADVTVSPTRGGGTALLRLGPGIVIPAQYGAGSAAAHLAAARALGLQADEIDLPGARSDVDAASDLWALEVAHDPAGSVSRDAADVIPVGRATASFLAVTRG